MDAVSTVDPIGFVQDHLVIIAILLDLVAMFFTAWVIRLGGGSPKIIGAAAAVLMVWLVVLHLTFSTQSIIPADIGGPAFLALVFAGVGVFGLGIFFTPVGRVLLGMDQQYLLMVQGIRVFFGAGFLLQTVVGYLPTDFGILDGFTHITAGFLGLTAAILVTRNGAGRMPILFANMFGLLDILIVASSLALILLPQMTPYHPMMYAVFLPAPIWLWCHVVSIYRLMVPIEKG